MTPISSNERILTIDIIRGFALLGIFLVNMPTFHSPDFMKQMYSVLPEYTGFDHFLYVFFTVFVKAKFYTIFSFLFGLGFYIFMKRAEEKGLNHNLLFFRRMIVLFLFGMLHLILLWFGDILHMYALTGLLLFLFYKRSNKTILTWAFILIFIFNAFMSLLFFLPESVLKEMNNSNQMMYTQKIDDYMNVYMNKDYIDWVLYRYDVEFLTIIENIPFALPPVLSMFLFGIYAGRKGFFQEDTSHLHLIRKIQGITFILSIPSILYLTFSIIGVINIGGYQQMADYVFISISGITLSLFYMSTLRLLVTKEKWTKALRPLGYAGQMALTNYLGQTIITMGIVFGFNLYGELSLTSGTILCLVIFPLQILISKYWLEKFKMGPLEWIWRSLTYGKVQAFKKEVNHH